MPSALLWTYAPEKGGSVPLRRRTSYCSGVSSARHSSSVLVISGHCHPLVALTTCRPRLLDLDEDALAGALLGGLDDGVLHPVGDVGQPLGAARFGEDLRALLDVGQAVVEQGEH